MNKIKKKKKKKKMLHIARQIPIGRMSLHCIRRSTLYLRANL